MITALTSKKIFLYKKEFLKIGLIGLLAIYAVNITVSAESVQPRLDDSPSLKDIQNLLQQQLEKLRLVQKNASQVTFPEKELYGDQIAQHVGYCKEFWEKLKTDALIPYPEPIMFSLNGHGEDKLFLHLRQYAQKNYTQFLKQKGIGFPSAIQYEGIPKKLDMNDSTSIEIKELSKNFAYAWRLESSMNSLFFNGDNLPQGLPTHFLYVEPSYIKGYVKPAVVTVIADVDKKENRSPFITGIKLRRVRLDGMPESGENYLQLLSPSEYAELKNISFATENIREPYEPFTLFGLGYFKKSLVVWGLRPDINSDYLSKNTSYELLVFRIDSPDFDETSTHCTIKIK